MLNHLSKFINNDVFNGAASTAILLYVYDNKITNTTQLLDRLLNEYLTANVSYGYLYCIDHYTYKIDGTNVYKLGQASNIKKRISSYATYYIKPVELKYASDRIKFYQFAELVLFKKLADCRISPNREFFDCEFDTIKKHIDDIALEFNTCSIIDILNKYEIDTKYINDIKNKIIRFMKNYTNLDKLIDFENSIPVKRVSPKSILSNHSLSSDEILNAQDIDQIKFDELLKKRLDNQASREDILSIERFTIKKDWNLNEISNEFLEKFCGKTHVLYNLWFLMDNEIIDRYILKIKKEYNIDFDKTKKMEQITMIREVISKLGFDNPNDNKELTRQTFGENVNNVKTHSQLFVNIKKRKLLFGCDPVKVNEIKTVKQFMGYMNSLFSKWGIVIRYFTKASSKKINGKKKTINTSSYSLCFLNDIDKYI